MIEPATHRLQVLLPASLAEALAIEAARQFVRPSQLARVLLARHMAAAARKPKRPLGPENKVQQRTRDESHG